MKRSCRPCFRSGWWVFRTAFSACPCGFSFFALLNLFHEKSWTFALFVVEYGREKHTHGGGMELILKQYAVTEDRQPRSNGRNGGQSSWAALKNSDDVRSSRECWHLGCKVLFPVRKTKRPSLDKRRSLKLKLVLSLSLCWFNRISFNWAHFGRRS